MDKSTLLSALRRAIGTLAASVLGAIVAGALSGYLLYPVDRRGGAIRSAALFAPFALPIAVLLVPLALVISQARVTRVRDALAQSRDRISYWSGHALISPVTSVIWVAWMARAGRYFITEFHNVGMASLAHATVFAMLSAFVWGVSALLRLGWQRYTRDRLIKPSAVVFTLGAGLLFALIAGIIGIKTGSEQGTGGVLGGLGVLKHKDLKLDPVYGLLGAIALSGLIALGTARSWIAGGVVLVVGAVVSVQSVRFIAHHFGESPAAAEIEARPSLAQRSLRMLRNRTDKDHDHYSALFDGGDCNDRDPKINPAEQEIAGNGVDEDCSGRDAPPPPPKPAPPPPAVQVKIEQSVPKEMNLVLITVDTLRWDLHYAGNPHPWAPSLDQLAETSTVIDTAYALSSYTGRAIGPLMTGRYPSEGPRDYGHFVVYPDANVFLAERLKTAGFTTFGAASHFYFERSSGLSQGVESWDMSARPTGDEQETTSRDAVVADRALEMLADPKKTSGRFFGWFHFFDPHKQYVRHPEVGDLGPGEHGKYNTEVAWTDRQIGRIVDAIRAAPYGKNTIIVVTADHGEAFGEHGMAYHGVELWEELVRVPWIISVPGFKPRHITTARGQIDLVPTLLELLRIAPPAADAPDALSGVSLVPDMIGEPLPPRPIFIELPEGPYNSLRRAVVDNGWKLLERGSHGAQLFHLTDDPGERTDLAHTAPDALERMKGVMEQVRASLHLVPERNHH